jgi:hypothetical protein
MLVARLLKSGRLNKKYLVQIRDNKGKIKSVHFGDSRYSDFTKHKDEKRKKKYLDRHETREDWSMKGVKTAGFWSRWLLWNRPSIMESISDINRRFYNQIKVELV